MIEMIDWIELNKELPPHDVLVLVRLRYQTRNICYRIAELCEDASGTPPWWVGDWGGLYDLEDITHWAHITAPSL